MSGIAGIVRLDGASVPPALAPPVLRALKHRGPDGEGSWQRGHVLLVQNVLWTTPESVRSPAIVARQQQILVADARIDNREELASHLDLGPAGQAPSDAELILGAYQKWGPESADRLLGDFAFALWDGDRQTLFCARDHFGVRPFYYSYLPGRFFAFASEIKGLFAIADVPDDLDDSMIANYLALRLHDRSATFYRHMRRLPAAHTLRLRAGAPEIRRYWKLDPEVTLELRSPGEYAEAFRDCFRRAVKCRLRTATPAVGAALSGGLDSSSIVCSARQILAREAPAVKLHSFSAIFPGLDEKQTKRIDERRFIDAVLAGGAIQANFIRADQLSPLGELDRMLRRQDEPFFAPNL
jgi:asparagine synthase (glutamine-hydrolysing)